MPIDPHAASAFELSRNFSMLTVLCEFTTTVYSHQHNHNVFFNKLNVTEPEVVTSLFFFFLFPLSGGLFVIILCNINTENGSFTVFLIVRDWNING